MNKIERLKELVDKYNKEGLIGDEKAEMNQLLMFHYDGRINEK
jgi:uncharacterized protein YnzC (UPF0291/DUF896 family)